MAALRVERRHSAVDAVLSVPASLICTGLVLRWSTPRMFATPLLARLTFAGLRPPFRTAALIAASENGPIFRMIGVDPAFVKSAAARRRKSLGSGTATPVASSWVVDDEVGVTSR